MIRIVGTLAAREGGSTVDYRIEFMPAALVALGVSVVATIPIFAAWSYLGYSLIPLLLLLLVAVVLTGTMNFWISERQAKWLRDYVISTLGAQTIARRLPVSGVTVHLLENRVRKWLLRSSVWLYSRPWIWILWLVFALLQLALFIALFAQSCRPGSPIGGCTIGP